MRLSTLLTIPSLAVLLVATMTTAPAAADGFTPSPPGQSDAAGALSTCNNILKKSPSPGMVSTYDYWEYKHKVDDAKEKDPAAITKLAAKTSYLGMNPKAIFPKCEKIIADYVAGVDAEKQPNLESKCEQNTAGDFKDIRSQASQLKGATGSIALMRNDIERARTTLYLFTGRKLTLAPCAPNDQHKKAFAPLAKRLKEYEAIVLGAEAAAGVRYMGSKDHGVTLDYIDVKTGQPVGAPKSGTAVDYTPPPAS